MSKFRTAFSKHEHFYCPEGTREVPTFALDDKGDLQITGKTSLFDEIQSHECECLLSRVIERCRLTGEVLTASAECFGDSTVLPDSLLDMQNRVNQVESFASSLSKEDLSYIKENGFDSYLSKWFDEHSSKHNIDNNSSEVTNE